MVKNYLSKILIAFVIIFTSFIPLAHTAIAKESYSDLFIKITDANTALKNNDKDKAKKLIEEFRNEFNATKNSDSEAGKRVKKTALSENLDEDQLRELSTALLAFETEQNPIDIEAEKSF